MARFGQYLLHWLEERLLNFLRVNARRIIHWLWDLACAHPTAATIIGGTVLILLIVSWIQSELSAQAEVTQKQV